MRAENQAPTRQKNKRRAEPAPETKKEDFLTNLPPELVNHILSFLPMRAQYICLNKSWRAKISAESLTREVFYNTPRNLTPKILEREEFYEYASEELIIKTWPTPFYPPLVDYILKYKKLRVFEYLLQTYGKFELVDTYVVDAENIDALALLTKYGIRVRRGCVERVISKGSVHFLDVLMGTGVDVHDEYILRAVAYNRYEIIEYLLARGLVFPPSTLVEPTRMDNFEMVRFLIAHGAPIPHQIFDYVQNARMVYYLFNIGAGHTRVTRFLIKKINTPLARFVLRKGIRFTDAEIREIMRSGRADLLKLIRRAEFTR